MKEKGSGQIVNITSGVGKRGLPGLSPYCATKSSLNALTESIRVELSPFGINVLSFSPGLVSTNFQNTSRVFGELKETFGGGVQVHPSFIAQKIVKSIEKKKRDVNFSLRSKMVNHINSWAPGILDIILKRKAMSRYNLDSD